MAPWSGLPDFRIEAVPFSGRTRLIIGLPRDILRELTRLSLIGCTSGCPILPSADERSVRARRIMRRIAGGLRWCLRQGLHDKSASVVRTGTTSHLDELLDCPESAILVVSSSAFRAACARGGTIVLHSGVLDRFDADDAAVAAVVCHELAHAVAQHRAEGNVREMLLLSLMLKFPVTREKNLKQLFFPPFSEKGKEKEADYIGMLLMASAGYDPRTAPRILRELGEMGGTRSRLEEFLSAHPTDEKRAELLSRPRVMEEALQHRSKSNYFEKLFLPTTLSLSPFSNGASPLFPPPPLHSHTPSPPLLHLLRSSLPTVAAREKRPQKDAMDLATEEVKRETGRRAGSGTGRGAAACRSPVADRAGEGRSLHCRK